MTQKCIVEANIYFHSTHTDSANLKAQHSL